jgi:ADP-ribose pyrophosphatase
MKKRRGFIRRGRAIAFSGRLLRVYLDDVVLPNGEAVTLETVGHVGAVLIVPFVSAQRVVLLRQLRPVIGRYILELPAGTRDGSEPWLSCARRELLEETGFCARTWEKLGLIVPVPGYSTETIHIFKASDLEPGIQHQEKDEIIQTRVMTTAQVRSLFRAGKIIDAKTISALCMCGVL